MHLKLTHFLANIVKSTKLYCEQPQKAINLIAERETIIPNYWPLIPWVIMRSVWVWWQLIGKGLSGLPLGFFEGKCLNGKYMITGAEFVEILS